MKRTAFCALPGQSSDQEAIVSLMKQARAFGVGVVVATQNPMDLDYRALSNAGLGCIGPLQTDADCARVLDGLAGAEGAATDVNLGDVIPQLAPRWFLVRNAHAPGSVLLEPRYAMSLLRGPMTRVEIQRPLGLTERARA